MLIPKIVTQLWKYVTLFTHYYCLGCLGYRLLGNRIGYQVLGTGF